MDRTLERMRQLVWMLVVTGWMYFHLASAQEADVVFINETILCSDTNSVPSGVRVSNVTNDSALIRWNSVPTSGSDIKGYEILYWPIASSVYETESVSSVEATETTIHDLSPYTQYLVAVRLYCGEDLFGLASVSVTFITEASAPSGAVTNLLAILSGSGEHKANISWSALKSEYWNGIPYGYYVYIFRYPQNRNCSGAPIDYEVITVGRNVTNISVDLVDNCYRVNVFPTNHRALGPESDPLYFIFNRSPLKLTLLSDNDVPPPTSAPATPFLKSGYVYIIVLGVLAVVPVVFGIVLFKKAKEKKRKVQYCRGVHATQHGDVQLSPLSPSSGSSAHFSPHPPGSRLQAFSPLSNPSPNTPSRPLLLSSPCAPPNIEHTRDISNLFAMPPVQSPTSPKFPQGISPVAEGGGSGFTSRNFNLEPSTSEVFVGGSSVGPPSVLPGPHRPRANTEGGSMNMPNPYEFPVHPGGATTLPRADFGIRSSGGQQGRAIPPPPSHAPPPLTQSSQEIFARASRSPPHNGKSSSHQLPPRAGTEHQRQAVLSHRSFSTTHTINPPAIPSTNSMRMIQSASQLHPVDEKEQGGPDYAVVYPPSDHSAGKVSTLDRHPPPHRLPHSPSHPPPSYVPNGSTRGTRNSDNLSSFSEMTDESGQGQMSSAPHHTPRHPETGVYRVGENESMFSETSEEPSLSSGSIREPSPSGTPSWVGGGSVDGADKKRRSSSSSTTPTNSRASHNQLQHPPVSPS